MRDEVKQSIFVPESSLALMIISFVTNIIVTNTLVRLLNYDER